MSKITVRHELEQLIRSGAIFCPYESGFYLNTKFLVLGKTDRVLSEFTTNQITGLLNTYPEFRIFAFNVNYKWDAVKREFDNSAFIDSLPEAIRLAKSLIALSCEDSDRANRFVELVRKGEYTGFFPLTDPKRENDIPSPGSSYIYLR